MARSDRTIERLPQPAMAEMELTDVMEALADPIRLTILQRLLVDGGNVPQSCGWIGIDRPKSTLTHHFRVLREAGLTEQHQQGTSRTNAVRVDELEQRFPGLLELVRSWHARTDVPVTLLSS